MNNEELEDQLEGLFSDTVPDFESDLDAEREDRSSLEETGLLGFFEEVEAMAEPAPAEPAPLPALPEAEEIPEEREGAPTSALPWEITLGGREINLLNLMLYGLIALGALPLLFFLIRLVWQKSMDWSGLPLYLLFYVLAVVVSLAQWWFNSSLAGTLQETENERDEAIYSRMPLENQVKGLAVDNASLQKRARQLQATVYISHSLTSVLEWDKLIRKAVNLIHEQFDLYYAGIFLVDETDPDTGEQWAVLRAGTGQAGAQMLAQGYRINVDDSSVVGRCIVNAQARIALDAASAQARLFYDEAPVERDEGASSDDMIDIVELNSLLPKTRSEMILPLFSDQHVIGVLDLHSTEREAFSEEDIPVLQLIADQVAAAIDNTLRYEEVQDRLEEFRRGRTQEERDVSALGQSSQLYERTRSDVKPIGRAVSSEVKQAVARREVVVQPGADDSVEPATLVAPIRLRDEIIGTLGLQELEGDRRWTDDEVALVEAVADQMALAIENARLLETTRRRAERERMTADIAASVRASTDVDTILRTAIQELGQSLRVSDGFIRLGADDGAASPAQKDATELT